MNIDLLKFMDRKVRIRKDPSHQEYIVLGIYWASEHILLVGDGGTMHVPYQDLDLVPENEDEDT